MISHAELALTFSRLTGWRRNTALLICGALGTLTLPPFFLFPLIILAFAGLFLLLTSAPTAKRGFWDGWWWGMGFYTTGLYWLCIALLTDPDKFAWLLPFALLAVPAALSIYTGIACLITQCLGLKSLSGIFVFSVIWTLVEFARGHFLGGFPWNIEGYSLAHSDATLQLASLVGAYGLTWFVVWLGTLPAALVDGFTKKKKAAFVLALAYGFLILGAAWGGWRLAVYDQLPEKERFVAGVKLRLVQPNIAQELRWDPKTQAQGLHEHIRMTQLPGLENITHVIWPETAVSYIIKPDTPLTTVLGHTIPPSALLITGGIRSDDTAPKWTVYNSIVAIDHQGKIIGIYDKSKLVPFGEFLPLRQFLPKILTTPVGDTDFSRGPGPVTVSWGGLNISPLICYEVIFPEQAIDPAHRPQVLLNVTNDAWFGLSTGPYQHFTMARMRAAEQGIPLIRAANTGISAVIDSFGRVVSKLDLGTQGILDEKLPSVQTDPTIYSSYGNGLIWTVTAVSILLIIRCKARGKS
jgi:apolipoprotein N-acyltransferase